MTTNQAGDAALAGALITSPGWAPILNDVNALLTTITLAGGLVLLAFRLSALWADLAEKRRQKRNTV
jgi:hypothetical protein